MDGLWCPPYYVVDTTYYYTQVLCKGELELKNKRLGGDAREIKNKVKLSLNWVWAGVLAELGKTLGKLSVHDIGLNKEKIEIPPITFIGLRQ